MRARTLAEIEADLPAGVDTVELRGTLGSVKRKGNWHVSRTLVLRTRLGSVELDFTEARIAYPVVTIELDTVGGPVEVRLPAVAAASLSGST